MNLKEIKNIFEGSKYFSKILIEDDFEINELINLWNENDVDISIEFNPDYLFGHLANIEIDANNDILMSGING